MKSNNFFIFFYFVTSYCVTTPTIVLNFLSERLFLLTTAGSPSRLAQFTMSAKSLSEDNVVFFCVNTGFKSH